MKTDAVPGIKRSVDVRLNKAVSEDVLRSIALKLKSEETGIYQRTFIFYYLPDMTPRSGAWATTHFNPELKVEIQGFTPEQAATPAATSNTLGRWIDNSPFTASHITLYREGGKLFLDTKFKDGSNMKTNVIEKQLPAGRRLEDAAGSERGEYFVVTPAGDLQICGSNGVIATAKKE
ncbi:MAG TPA: hypothetical protein VF595_08975 [Tepidisphaeraceae bacterium]